MYRFHYDDDGHNVHPPGLEPHTYYERTRWPIKITGFISMPLPARRYNSLIATESFARVALFNSWKIKIRLTIRSARLSPAAKNYGAGPFSLQHSAVQHFYRAHISSLLPACLPACRRILLTLGGLAVSYSAIRFHYSRFMAYLCRRCG